MTIAWVFPGQGSQKIGMAKQIENLPNAKMRFNYASEVFERNLFDICELKPDSKNILGDLNNTRNTQFFIFFFPVFDKVCIFCKSACINIERNIISLCYFRNRFNIFH